MLYSFCCFFWFLSTLPMCFGFVYSFIYSMKLYYLSKKKKKILNHLDVSKMLINLTMWIVLNWWVVMYYMVPEVLLIQHKKKKKLKKKKSFWSFVSLIHFFPSEKIRVCLVIVFSPYFLFSKTIFYF